jgi:hypothetical protein
MPNSRTWLWFSKMEKELGRYIRNRRLELTKWAGTQAVPVGQSVGKDSTFNRNHLSGMPPQE